MNENQESKEEKSFCDYCPMHCMAEEQPNSFFAEIHRWCSSWCPGWQKYEEEQRARENAAVNQA